MKCIVYVSFSLFVLIDTPHYAIFAFQFHVGSFLFVEWNHVNISILDCNELLQIFDELTNYSSTWIMWEFVLWIPNFHMSFHRKEINCSSP